MENQEYIRSLIKQFTDGNISKDAYAELVQYLNTAKDNDNIYEAMDRVWDKMDNLEEYSKSEADLFYQKLISDQRFSEVKTYKLWSRVAAAAAVLLIVGLSIFFYTSYYAPRHLEGSAATRDLLTNDIKPGSNKAYLVLSNGKRVSLTDAANGELAKEAGVEITKTADGQVVYKTATDISDRINGRHPVPDLIRDLSGSRTSYSNALNTIETPRGGQYQIRLPDGSKVWLNAASKLIYPVTFNGRGQRVVELSGEAYFEIFKNKLQPFVVKSKNQEVTVLGTHFNINTYDDEPNTKTTLLEGSVQVSGRHPEFISGPPLKQVLKPGQQSILAGGKINVIPADLIETMAWQKGDFVFKNESLESIMRKICRWYNVEVIYVGKIDTKQTFSGQVSRNKNISEVLKALESGGTLKFKIEGKKIRITN
ncbi:FecR family protein [Pedobacter nutrimenti]|uniref:FecR family protein n=1 Tax=Pedobacter nutrimenti TaxID=1241337 RepID=UPI00292CA883|nr:FecR domain-containing protein [Pedobacter nutrimenti]